MTAPFVAITVGLADRLIRRLAEDTDVGAREMRTELIELLGDAQAHQQHVEMLAEELLVTLARESGRDLPTRLDATSLLAAKAAICSMSKSEAEVLPMKRPEAWRPYMEASERIREIVHGDPSAGAEQPSPHALMYREANDKRVELLGALAVITGKSLPLALDDHTHAMATIRTWHSNQQLDAAVPKRQPIKWALYIDGAAVPELRDASFMPAVGTGICLAGFPRLVVLSVTATSGHAVDVFARSIPETWEGSF